MTNWQPAFTIWKCEQSFYFGVVFTRCSFSLLWGNCDNWLIKNWPFTTNLKKELPFKYRWTQRLVWCSRLLRFPPCSIVPNKAMLWMNWLRNFWPKPKAFTCTHIGCVACVDLFFAVRPISNDWRRELISLARRKFEPKFCMVARCAVSCRLSFSRCRRSCYSSRWRFYEISRVCAQIRQSLFGGVLFWRFFATLVHLFVVRVLQNYQSARRAHQHTVGCCFWPNFR